MSGRFFQIDRSAWERVARLGLNATVCYLVLACGTGQDNRTTAWSVNAIEKYTSIGRTLAKRALNDLVELGAITRVQGGTKPRYYLAPIQDRDELGQASGPLGGGNEAHWIWLPNALVTGVQGECPPLERVRGLQEPRTLRQLIALYDSHNLPEDGGIHWRHVRRTYKRERITERGMWVLWSFSPGGLEASRTEAAWEPFRRRKTGKSGSDVEAAEFWSSWRDLERLGLVECVPHLVEADTRDAVLICPCPAEDDPGTPQERALGEAARAAAVAMLESSLPHRLNSDNVIIPVPDRYPKVAMFGIYRLRYRPHTSKTAAWIAKAESHRDWQARYAALLHSDPLVKVA